MSYPMEIRVAEMNEQIAQLKSERDLAEQKLGEAQLRAAEAIDKNARITKERDLAERHLGSALAALTAWRVAAEDAAAHLAVNGRIGLIQSCLEQDDNGNAESLLAQLRKTIISEMGGPQHDSNPQHDIDWTRDENGRSNSSPEYMRICSEVEKMIRSSSFDLIAGRSDVVAQVVVAHLAHRLGLVPYRQIALKRMSIEQETTLRAFAASSDANMFSRETKKAVTVLLSEIDALRAGGR